jgi:hypothetical protein
VPAATSSPDSGLSVRLSRPLALASAWAGDSLALIVGGSHAAGLGVWVALEGREFCLSDLDVYAVVRDRAAQRAAETRARADRLGLRGRLLDWGLAAPLEVAFLVPADLARLRRALPRSIWRATGSSSRGTRPGAPACRGGSRWM